jgi:glycogen debranching enzyme
MDDPKHTSRLLLGTLAKSPALAPIVRDLTRQSAAGGVDTSAGLLFNHSVWGRDRVITALDLIDFEPSVARDTIVTLAGLQGVGYGRRSEEEPGRIHSERRDLRDWQAPAYLKAVFRYVISPMWGGTAEGYTTYSSSDATPLYVMLVCAAARVDPALLDLVVTTKDGGRATVRDTVERAVGWIERHIGERDLVEVPKRNLLSLQPVWRDGPTSNFDEAGRMLNVVDPVAYLDVQVLCFEALTQAARMEGVAEARTQKLLAEARALRDATIRDFWMLEEQYFGMALDRDADGKPRLLRAVQSNAGWMLATGFFDDLHPDDRRRFLSGIVRALFAPEMLTDVGVRGRSLAASNRRFRSYHENVWPVDTAMIAHGLRRQGFAELAEQLENRLLNAANALGDAYEFLVVDDDGRVVLPTLTKREAERLFGWPRPLASEMVPERRMAWTATALLRIKRERVVRARGVAAAARETTSETPWQEHLTRHTLAGMRSIAAGATRLELAEAFTVAPAYLDHTRGLLLSAEIIAVQGFGGVVPRAYGARLRRALQGRVPAARGLSPVAARLFARR